jgi:hypothetical protein
MVRVRKRLSRFACLIAAVLVAAFSAAPTGAAEMSVYPAGTRIAVPAAPETRFRIAAEGPAVLWIRAESPHLLKLKVESAEAAAWVEAADGWAECVVPVYEAGTVDVMLTAQGMGGHIIVTTSYGIGTNWDAATVNRAIRMLSASAPPAAVPPPASAVPQPPPPVAPPPAPTEPVIQERPTPPAPAAVTPAPPVAPPAASTPPPAPPPAQPPPPPAAAHPQVSREIPFLTNPASLSIGELAMGSLPESGEPGLATYRVYIPNNLGFSVFVNGRVHVRVRAVDSISEMGDYSAATQKVIRFPAPSESWYLISLRGFGSYGVTVETNR